MLWEDSVSPISGSLSTFLSYYMCISRIWHASSGKLTDYQYHFSRLPFLQGECQFSNFLTTLTAQIQIYTSLLLKNSQVFASEKNALCLNSLSRFLAFPCNSNSRGTEWESCYKILHLLSMFPFLWDFVPSSLVLFQSSLVHQTFLKNGIWFSYLFVVILVFYCKVLHYGKRKLSYMFLFKF